MNGSGQADGRLQRRTSSRLFDGSNVIICTRTLSCIPPAGLRLLLKPRGQCRLAPFACIVLNAARSPAIYCLLLVIHVQNILFGPILPNASWLRTVLIVDPPVNGMAHPTTSLTVRMNKFQEIEQDCTSDCFVPIVVSAPRLSQLCSSASRRANATTT